jgi:cell division septum initiation protein DivIVA
MSEIKLRSKHLNSLKKIVEDALAEKAREIENGIKRTQERITLFENKYQMPTEEFLRRFKNNELQHTLEFDEWMGEAWILGSLIQDKEGIEEIEFVD